jgi:hypothetical protein
LLLATAAARPRGEKGCGDRPEVRFYLRAWNAQMGMLLATGGKQAAPGSPMCRRGVNLRLIREDSAAKLEAQMAAFAQGLKGGGTPSGGAHFIAIAGDSSAAFLKGLNDRLRKLGPEYTVAVVGSAGYSRGEDKFLGPIAWKETPIRARGGLVAGVPRESGWNLALDWLGDNKIPNNPDETRYDPDALNWVPAADPIDAARKYASGHCADLRNVKTGTKERHCVEAVVTRTPGDLTVAEQKGGLVSITSTRENRLQVPDVIVGHRKWMADHRALVQGMLAAIFEGAEQIRKDPAMLRKAAEVSALVYGEKDAAHWLRYFRPVTQKDKQGLTVELGGSTVNGLAENLQLFGMAGRTNYFAVSYTTFGDIVKAQYSRVVPAYDPVEQVVDLSYLESLAPRTRSRVR